MLYRAHQISPYSVLIEFSKSSGKWAGTKLRNRKFMGIGDGPTLDGAMLQVSMIGLAPDEPIDSDT
jgi:hypothetical protein